MCSRFDPRINSILSVDSTRSFGTKKNCYLIAFLALVIIAFSSDRLYATEIPSPEAITTWNINPIAKGGTWFERWEDVGDAYLTTYTDATYYELEDTGVDHYYTQWNSDRMEEVEKRSHRYKITFFRPNGSSITSVTYYQHFCENLILTLDRGACLSPATQDKSNIGVCRSTNHTVGGSIDYRLGNVVELKNDIVMPGALTITLTRYYNSHPSSATGSFGKGWTHTFDRKLQLNSENNTIEYSAEGGTQILYEYRDDSWVAMLSGRHPELIEITGGFELVYDTFTENYDISGNLINIKYLKGNVIEITRDSQSRIAHIGIDDKQVLNFLYGDNGLLSSIDDFTGRTWSYEYDSNNSLISMVRPDGKSITYHYEDGLHPHALTGVTDERGLRVSIYTYDSLARVTSSKNLDTVAPLEVSYDSALTRTINGPGYDAEGMHIKLIEKLGRLETIEKITGLGSQQKTFNHDGLEASITTAGGRVTEYPSYDPNGNPTQIVQAAGTAQEVTQHISYDPSLNVPVEIREPSVYAGAEKITSISWDAYGNPTAFSINGFTPDGVVVNRTLNLEYNGPYHQLTRIDGARSDVNDWTQFTYWPIDSSPNAARLKQITDAMGTITFDNAQYSVTGKLLSYDLPNGLSVSLTYYPNSDRLETLTQSDGSSSRVTHWSYNAAGKVETITTAYGTPQAQTLILGYDAALRLIRVTDSAGNYVDYTLDGNGNATNISQYGDNGSLLQTLDAVYDDYGRLTSMASGALQLASQTLGPDNEVLSHTDGKGTKTSYAYDGLLRLTQEVRDSEGSYLPVDFAYDVIDQLSATSVGGAITTTYVTDDLGNRIREVSPDRGTLSYGYDAAGNTTTITNALGQTASISYDAAGRPLLIDREGTDNDVTFTYDAAPGCAHGAGQLCKVMDASGNVTYSYTPFGELAAKVHTIDGVSYTTSYSYRIDGALANITLPSGRTLSLNYDTYGKPDSISDTSHTFISAIDWRGDDLVATITYGNGIIDSRTYSADLAQLVGQDIGTLENSAYAYDDNGNILSITNASPSTYQYDALNRLVSEDNTQYDYDDNGNRKSFSTSGQGYTYESDSWDELNKSGSLRIEDPNLAVIKKINGPSWATITSKLPREGKSYFEVKLSNAYYFSVGLSTYDVPKEDAVFSNTKAIGYTNWHNRVVYNDTRLSAYAKANANDVIGVAVDADNNLAWWSINGVWIQGDPSIGHNGFDLPASFNSNPIFAAISLYGLNNYVMTYLDPSSFNYSPPSGFEAQAKENEVNYHYKLASNQLIGNSDTAITRDAAGNRTSDQNGNRTFHYDSAGHLVEIKEGGVTIATYAYDHHNQRVSKTTATGTVHYHYDASGRLWAETDGQGNPIRDYIWMGDMPVAMVDYLDVTERVTYLHADHLNTPRYATNQVGDVVWQWQSDAFGNGIPAEDVDGDGVSVQVNLRFPGQYYDSESGLHYNYHRYYDPSIGRYITSDPIGLEGGLNTYAYVGGNPASWIDPLGLYETDNHGNKKPAGSNWVIGRKGYWQRAEQAAQEAAFGPNYNSGVLSGSVGLEVSAFVGILGFSTSGGVVTDHSVLGCSYSSSCVQVGLGVYGGYGVSCGVADSSQDIEPGDYTSESIFMNGGLGAVGGVLLDLDSPVSLGGAFGGKGGGFAIGYQQCQVRVFSCK
jgi:RHS repeat-associated protein